jgi:hypothetical protein
MSRHQSQSHTFVSRIKTNGLCVAEEVHSRQVRRDEKFKNLEHAGAPFTGYSCMYSKLRLKEMKWRDIIGAYKPTTCGLIRYFGYDLIPLFCNFNQRCISEICTITIVNTNAHNQKTLPNQPG